MLSSGIGSQQAGPGTMCDAERRMYSMYVVGLCVPEQSAPVLQSNSQPCQCRWWASLRDSKMKLHGERGAREMVERKWSRSRLQPSANKGPREGAAERREQRAPAGATHRGGVAKPEKPET